MKSLLLMVAVLGCAASLLLLACDKPVEPEKLGTLYIRSNQSNTTYFVDKLNVRGKTPDYIEDVKLGTYVIRYELPNYIPDTITVGVRADGLTYCDGFLLRGIGALSLTSDPSEAWAAIINPSNGKYVLHNTLTPLFVDSLPSGDLRLMVSKAGYFWVDTTITVLINDTTDIAITLDSTLAWITVTSEPSAATVTFSGIEGTRMTPFVDSLTPGTYTMTIAKDGYRTKTHTVTLTQGSRLTFHFDLELITGSVAVASNPAGASVIIDGQATGYTTPADLTLVPGYHGITLRRNAYLDADTSVTIIADKSQSLNVTLTPRPVSLTVSSVPTGAAIILKGEATNYVTPHTFTDVAPGDWRIRLTKDGFFPAETTVTVPIGVDQQTTLNLASAPVLTFTYTIGSDILLANADGTILDTLAHDYDYYVEGSVGHYGEVRWSPNGHYLAYTGLTKAVSIIDEHGTWENGFDGNRSTDFCWSPDSDVLLWGLYCGGMRKHVLSTNWYGAFTGSCYDNSPTFSPDGSRILFSLLNWRTTCWLVVINPDGSGRRNVYGSFRVTTTDQRIMPAWTSDSTALFKVTSQAVYELHLPDTGAAILTVRSTDPVQSIRVSPNGQWCAYWTSVGLYLMRTDEWVVRRVIEHYCYDYAFTENGEYVLIRSTDGVYFVKTDGTHYHVIDHPNAGRGAIRPKP